MEVTTARFLLRDFVEADRPACLAYNADPRNLASYGPDEARPEHAAHLFETFQAWASKCPRLNYQPAIARREEPQALVGCCGLRGAGRTRLPKATSFHLLRDVSTWCPAVPQQLI